MFLFWKFSNEYFHYEYTIYTFPFYLGVNTKQSSSGSSRKNDQASGKRQPKNMRFDNEKIIERFKKKVPNKTMLETRKGLPAWNEQENILKALDNHQVLVVSGMTGCGKSTQVPQYILDASLSNGTVKQNQKFHSEIQPFTPLATFCYV